jgi:hypothetical protein
VKSSLTVIGHPKLSQANASDALALISTDPAAATKSPPTHARTHGWHPRAPDPVMTATPDTTLTPRRGNQYGKLRWCTERRRLVVEF